MVIQHFLGKEKVPGSNPGVGSISRFNCHAADDKVAWRSPTTQLAPSPTTRWSDSHSVR